MEKSRDETWNLFLRFPEQCSFFLHIFYNHEIWLWDLGFRRGYSWLFFHIKIVQYQKFSIVFSIEIFWFSKYGFGKFVNCAALKVALKGVNLNEMNMQKNKLQASMFPV